MSNKITYGKKTGQASSKPPSSTASKLQVTASSTKRLKTNPPPEPLASTTSSSKKPVTKNFAKSIPSWSDDGQAVDALDQVAQEIKQLSGNLGNLRVQVAGSCGQNHVLAQQLHTLQTQSTEDAKVAKLATEVAGRTAHMAADKTSEKLRIQEAENQRLREQVLESNTSRKYEFSIKQIQEVQIVELKSTIADMQKAEKAREQEASRDYRAKVDDMNTLQNAHALEAEQHLDTVRENAQEIYGLKLEVTMIDFYKQAAASEKKYAKTLKDALQDQTDHVATQKDAVKKLEAEILAKDQKIKECMEVEARLSEELQKEKKAAMSDVLYHLNDYQGEDLPTDMNTYLLLSYIRYLFCCFFAYLDKS
ncbi:hypothetical protein Ptr902_06475 [Pyrenophora tritici-repentis]|nr:hypothetical protein Ptr902_06475 [Pyrenophora tritici-repentis]